jgi:hypothetical protein
MTKINQTYVKQGRDLAIVTRAEGEVLNRLPVGVYRLCFNPVRGWWFSNIQEFKLPGKLYGNTEARSERILRTYNSRREEGDPTGILLSGIKGSGKTLLAKKVASDSNLPIIVINDPYVADDFKEIIANVGPCVLIFDEFEKVYAQKEHQNKVLTLLDGVFSNEVLSFIIVNDATRLVGPLLNRPGRLYYALEYGGLDEEFILEYTEDRLHDSTPERVKGILSISAMFKHFTFDHLQAMVEEMNRYGETAKEVIDFLNVKIPKPSIFELYDVRIWMGDQELTGIQDKSFCTQSKTPINSHVYLHYRKSEEEEAAEHYISLSDANLIDVNIEEQIFTFFEQGSNVRVTYKKSSDSGRTRFFAF